MYEEQKKYLELEKNLLQERYDARKSASDMAEKEEELAELKRQYAAISLDSTRAKETLELAAKIADAEKEINDTKDQEILDAQTAMIDDQITAYDEMTETEQSDLEDFLEDANNFTEELNSILEMSQEDMLDWLQANVHDFALATAEAQEQMIDGWTDTFNAMHNITERWNDEIATIMAGGTDNIMEFMLGSDTYANMTDAEKEAEKYRIQNIIDAWTDAYKDTVDSSDHTDSWASNYYSSSSSSSAKANTTATDNNTTAKNDNTTATQKATTATTTLKEKLEEASTAVSTVVSNIGSKVSSAWNSFWSGLSDAAAKSKAANSSEFSNYASFANGGVVDFTGLAMLHGTPSNPEYVLNAQEYRDLLKYNYNPFVPDTSSYTKSNNTITVGDIVINTSAISDDADIESLAEMIGQKFNEQLNANGFNTTMLTYR